MMRQMNPDSLKGMASLLQQYGRNGDTMLAHINPKEAMLLDRVSGGGSMNPMTGMPEFYEGGTPDGEDPGDPDTSDDVGDDPGDAPGDIGAEIDMMDPNVDPDASLGLVDGSLPGLGSLDGAGGLFGNLTPDRPGILDVLTAPLETLISALTLGTVDPEFTGKDVFGVPGLPSSDLSRGISGISGAQPVGVEIGFSPVGTVGIDQSGISGYAGPVTDLFSDLMNPDTAKSLVSANPDLAAQLANEKWSSSVSAAIKAAEDAPITPTAGYPRYAQGGPVSLGSLYNNVRARRGPITGGQRSGGGIMSLR